MQHVHGRAKLPGYSFERARCLTTNLMMEVLVDSLTREEWSEHASAFADYSLYHTWDYGDARASAEGSTVSRAAVRLDGKTLGMAQCRIKRIPLTKRGIAYIQWGPLCRRDRATRRQIQAVVSAICRTYVRSQRLLLRMVPPLWSRDQIHVLLDAAAMAGLRKNAYIWPYRTFVLDVSAPVDDLYSSLARRWKRALKKAANRKLHILCGRDEALFSRFLPLYEDMFARKRFARAVDPLLFYRVQQRLPKQEKMLVQLALWDNHPVAGLISSHLGDTCLGLLGASNETGRRSQAAYRLHWENVQSAKANGLRWYDFGGIDREKNPNGYLFKAGLGGEECECIGAYEACDSRATATALSVAEIGYRWVTGVGSSTR